MARAWRNYWKEKAKYQLGCYGYKDVEEPWCYQPVLIRAKSKKDSPTPMMPPGDIYQLKSGSSGYVKRNRKKKRICDGDGEWRKWRGTLGGYLRFFSKNVINLEYILQYEGIEHRIQQICDYDKKERLAGECMKASQINCVLWNAADALGYDWERERALKTKKYNDPVLTGGWPDDEAETKEGPKDDQQSEEGSSISEREGEESDKELSDDYLYI